MEDFYRLEDSMQHFANEPGHGNMYSQDEFQAALDVKDAVSAKDLATKFHLFIFILLNFPLFRRIS